MNDQFKPIQDLNMFKVVSPGEVKRDTKSLLEMLDEMDGKILIKQIDLETCSDDDFKAAFEYITWEYLEYLCGGGGSKPNRPDFIEAMS